MLLVRETGLEKKVTLVHHSWRSTLDINFRMPNAFSLSKKSPRKISNNYFRSIIKKKNGKDLLRMKKNLLNKSLKKNKQQRMIVALMNLKRR